MDEVLLQLIVSQIPLTIDVGIVKSVDGDICHVESETTEKDFFKVRINAIENNQDNRLKIIPEVGSSVVIGIFKGTEKAIILSVSKVSRLDFKQQTTEFEIDADGYQIKRDGINLKNVLKQGLINQNKVNQELQKVMVSMGVTPDVPSLQSIKQNNEQVINDLLKVFK